MDEKDVFCVVCGEGIVINLDLIDQEIECPACHTRLRLDEADDDSGHDDIEWSPDVDATDATRVFGASGHPATEESSPAATEPPSASPIAPPPAKQKAAAPYMAIAAVAGIALTGFFLQQEIHHSERLEARVGVLETTLISMKRTPDGLDDVLPKITNLENYLDGLDDTVSQIATVVRLQNATSLQNEYSTQSTRKDLMRQESEFGKLSLKVAAVEHEVADKSRQAQATFELAVKQRKEAEEASVPIRKRMRDLEAQKTLLFAQYRAGSIAKRPQGVVSSRRAAGLMKDYETKAAPLLAQIQSEIAGIREAIEAEEAKIDQLFQN